MKQAGGQSNTTGTGNTNGGGTSLQTPSEIKARIRAARRLRLFLDYDGTLADFAPTPQHVNADPEVIELLTKLADHPRIRLSVISGRRLSQVEQLVPIPNVLLAGTYGVELSLPHGERVDRVPYEDVRPVLIEIKPQWSALIKHREGFFLEDKGWALALHARDAAAEEAEEILCGARHIAKEAATSDLFRLLGGHRFLEIGPTLAHKGKTVAYLLERYPSPQALPVYVGDDDKDEEAFGVIHAHGGVAIRVCGQPCDTVANGRLGSPGDVRTWLAGIVAHVSDPGGTAPPKQDNRQPEE